ncbi:MAG: hypothetical protein P8Y02_02325 [Deinococcales bacterium]
MSPDPAIRVLDASLRALEEHGITYSIASGTEALPEALGRDVDLLVARRSITAAVSAVRHTSRALGWSVITANRRTNGHVWMILADDASSRLLEIDLVPFYSWFVFPLAFPRRSDSDGCPLAVDPWAHFAKKRLVPALAGRSPAARTTSPTREGADAAELVIRNELARLLGERFPDVAIEQLVHGSGEAFRRAGTAARRRLLLRTARDPRRIAALALPFFLRNRLSHLLDRRLAPIVAVVGPDGVGKSTVIAEVRGRLHALLPITGVEVLHWRPRLLPDLSTYLAGSGDVSRGTAGPPRRSAGRFATLRALYYGLDVWLGYWLRQRHASSRLVLTIFDRCYLDMVVDPLRYGLAHGRTAHRLWRFLPKPDLVIVLHDAPEHVLARKGELTLQEVEHQSYLWELLMQRDPRVVQVAVTDDVAETADRVAQRIVEAFLRLAASPRASKGAAA